jgi:CspA family cold shock protein
MPTAVVKWFDEIKGYGFIENNSGEEIFVHFTNIIDQRNGFKTLEPGSVVEYEAVNGEKGPKALYVKLKSESVSQ